jgi:hypothetical protein
VVHVNVGDIHSGTFKKSSSFEKLKTGELFQPLRRLTLEEDFLLRKILPWKITRSTFAPKLIDTAPSRGG